MQDSERSREGWRGYAAFAGMAFDMLQLASRRPAIAPSYCSMQQCECCCCASIHHSYMPLALGMLFGILCRAWVAYQKSLLKLLLHSEARYNASATKAVQGLPP